MPNSRNPHDMALARLLESQHGVVAREQTLRCGLTPAAVRHRIRPGGPWQVLLPGVYLSATGSVTESQRAVAALLHAGPRAIITGAAALRLHGLPEAPPTALIDVLVPIAVRRASQGFARLHHTNRMPEQMHILGPLRYAMAPRAVADAVRVVATLREARSVVASAVQRRRCPIPLLAQELQEGPDQGSGFLRAALAEVADGIRSVAEGDFRRLLKKSRLPMPMFNPRLMRGSTLIAVVDAWWPQAGVAVEIDSREWHLSPQQWAQTMERHARLSACGVIVLHFSPEQVRRNPQLVVETIKVALSNRAGQGAELSLQALPAD